MSSLLVPDVGAVLSDACGWMMSRGLLLDVESVSVSVRVRPCSGQLVLDVDAGYEEPSTGSSAVSAPVASTVHGLRV